MTGDAHDSATGTDTRSPERGLGTSTSCAGGRRPSGSPPDRNRDYRPADATSGSPGFPMVRVNKRRGAQHLAERYKSPVGFLPCVPSPTPLVRVSPIHVFLAAGRGSATRQTTQGEWQSVGERVLGRSLGWWKSRRSDAFPRRSTCPLYTVPPAGLWAGPRTRGPAHNPRGEAVRSAGGAAARTPTSCRPCAADGSGEAARGPQGRRAGRWPPSPGPARPR